MAVQVSTTNLLLRGISFPFILLDCDDQKNPGLGAWAALLNGLFFVCAFGVKDLSTKLSSAFVCNRFRIGKSFKVESRSEDSFIQYQGAVSLPSGAYALSWI
jgi:hypothetical protein